MPKFSDNLDKLGVLSRMSRLDKVENLSSLSKASALYILYRYCIAIIHLLYNVSECEELSACSRGNSQSHRNSLG